MGAGGKPESHKRLLSSEYEANENLKCVQRLSTINSFRRISSLSSEADVLRRISSLSSDWSDPQASLKRCAEASYGVRQQAMVEVLEIAKCADCASRKAAKAFPSRKLVPKKSGRKKAWYSDLSKEALASLAKTDKQLERLVQVQRKVSRIRRNLLYGDSTRSTIKRLRRHPKAKALSRALARLRMRVNVINRLRYNMTGSRLLSKITNVDLYT